MLRGVIYFSGGALASFKLPGSQARMGHLQWVCLNKQKFHTDSDRYSRRMVRFLLSITISVFPAALVFLSGNLFLMVLVLRPCQKSELVSFSVLKMILSMIYVSMSCVTINSIPPHPSFILSSSYFVPLSLMLVIRFFVNISKSLKLWLSLFEA